MQEEKLHKLQQSGFRLTRARREIVSVFSKATMPLSAGELQSQLTTTPNKSTIYRELLFLVEQGILAEVNVGLGAKYYEPAGRGHHHHLVCDRCEAIEDIVLNDDLGQLEAEVASARHFDIRRHSLEFFGICNKCQAAG